VTLVRSTRQASPTCAMLRSDDVSDARANDRHVCPTTQPFIPNWTDPHSGSESKSSGLIKDMSRRPVSPPASLRQPRGAQGARSGSQEYKSKRFPRLNRNVPEPQRTQPTDAPKGQSCLEPTQRYAHVTVSQFAAGGDKYVASLLPEPPMPATSLKWTSDTHLWGQKIDIA